MEVPNEQRGRCSGGHGMPSQPRYTTFQERKLQLQCLLPGGSLPKSCPHKYMSPRLARCEPYLAQVSFSPAQVAQLPMHPSLLHHSPRHHKAARSHQAYCLTDLALRALNTQRIEAASAVSCIMSINAAAPLWLRAALLKHRAHLDGDVVGRIVRRVRSGSESATASP